MPLKFIINMLLFLTLIMVSYPGFTSTELEKLAKIKFADSSQVIPQSANKEILAACVKDAKSKQPISQKEKEVCANIFKAELAAKDSYHSYMKACAYRKIADSTRLMPGFYDQYFVDYLSKHNAIYLVDSKNPNDRIKLETYKNSCMKEISKKYVPLFLAECKKQTPYSVFYKNLSKKR